LNGIKNNFNSLFMDYAPKDYTSLLGLPGLSENLLKTHFTLYQGYVTNTNKLAMLLAELLAQGKTATPEYAELSRRFGWEFNGMRLHELYFENLTKTPSALASSSALSAKIARDFGAFENWLADFKAKGTMRGIGWVILCHDKTADRLFNVWINEHDVGHLAGATPLLVMDVFEHAFLVDYGTKRIDYIEVFLKSIDWAKVEARL